MKKIAITGPESSGKTTLAKMLAAHYETAWVSEFARAYLSRLHRPYIESDLLAIAKGQLHAEQQQAAFAQKFLFCDSDLTVIKIWAEVKYACCDAWILEQIQKTHYDLYFLCAPDIAWEADPLRENPNNRNELFQLYVNDLDNRNISYIILKGNKMERLETAIAALNIFLT